MDAWATGDHGERRRGAEPRQCIGTSSAVGWTTRASLDAFLSYRISRVALISTYANVGGSMRKSPQHPVNHDSTLLRTQRLGHSKNTFRNTSSSTRRKEKASAITNCEIYSARSLCARVPATVNVYARRSTRARLSPLVAARAKCLFNSLNALGPTRTRLSFLVFTLKFGFILIGFIKQKKTADTYSLKIIIGTNYRTCLLSRRIRYYLTKSFSKFVALSMIHSCKYAEYLHKCRIWKIAHIQIMRVIMYMSHVLMKRNSGPTSWTEYRWTFEK